MLTSNSTCLVIRVISMSRRNTSVHANRRSYPEIAHPHEYDSVRDGVIITNQECVDDLRVLREHRRQGVGTRLLAQGESEIAARGCQTGRLRVVKSNLVAIQFYRRQGWQSAREFAHKKYHHPMLEMVKSFPSPQQT